MRSYKSGTPNPSRVDPSIGEFVDLGILDQKYRWIGLTDSVSVGRAKLESENIDKVLVLQRERTLAKLSSSMHACERDNESR